MLTFPTTHTASLGDPAKRIRVLIQSVHSGALMLISTAQWLGSQKLLSRVALASKGSADKHYQKNLRRRLRLERVVDGQLVIPWERVRIWCVELLYYYVGAVEVCQ
jgi:hypothetical protein